MTFQGFIQTFSVGVGKKHVHRATTSRGMWGDAPPGDLHALRWLLGLQNGWKLAANELLSIKKNFFLNSGGGGGGGDPSAPPPPLYDTLPSSIMVWQCY